MTTDDERLENAARETEIIRPPRQHLSTFGTTNLYYYLVTEPVYKELEPDLVETVVREGRVITERPRIVTPYYLTRLEGFSAEARRYFRHLIEAHGANAAGLYYTYRNEPKELNIVSDRWPAVVSRISSQIDERGDPLACIIKGPDDLWDVALLRFIYEITKSSIPSNVSQMNAMGMLDVDDSGIPVEARVRIEELFQQVSKGEREPGELKTEIDRWNAFDFYQDRFFRLFKRAGLRPELDREKI